MSTEITLEYKQTEIGALPISWDVQALQDICCEQITYGIVQCGPNIPNGVPYIRVSDMAADCLSPDGMLRTSKEIASRFIRSTVKAGEIVYALRGKLGEVRVVPDELDGANLTQGTARLAPKSHISSTYLLWALREEGLLKRSELEGKGSTFREITLADLRRLPLPVPPREEQDLIATALSSVDTLIRSLDQIIVKKRDLKQAAMQQLLTGHKRLPGFSGEWAVCPLGDVMISCSSGATPRRNRPEFFVGNVPWITSGELNFNVILDTAEKITKEAIEETNLSVVPPGTFLMAITGLEAEGTRGACGITGVASTTNQSCMAIYPSDKLFVQYLFHYYVFRGKALALQYCQGTKQQSYTAGLVKKLPIELPPTIEEQTAIASILSSMDTELAAIEARRDKARQLKQGMMQELLTGRVRLV